MKVPIFDILLQIAQKSGLFKRCACDRKKKYITMWRNSSKYDGVMMLRADLVVVIRGKCRSTGERVFRRIDMMDPNSINAVEKTLLELVGTNESNNSR